MEEQPVDEQNLSVESDEEYDENGRLVLPSRTDEADEVSEVSDEDNFSPQSPVNLIRAMSRSVAMSSRRLLSSAGPSSTVRGRGKGGIKLQIVKGQLKKVDRTPEEISVQKENWKNWLVGYTMEIKNFMKKNKVLHILECPDCY